MNSNSAAVSKRWLLVLPVAFLLHDLEELATVKTWMAANSNAVPAIIRDHIPQDRGTLMIAFVALFLVYLVAVLAVLRPPTSRTVGAVLGMLIMARLTNGLAHIAQGVLFAGYTPGLVTAVAVEIPVAMLGIHRLEGWQLSRKSERLALFAAGWIVQAVGIVAVIALATSIAER